MTKLDKAANIALILACMALIGALARNYYLSRLPDPGIELGIEKGEQVKLSGDASADTQTAQATLVLALSTHCGFCQESAPFYQKLAAFKNSSPARVRLATVMTEPKEEIEAYLKKQGIAADAVFSMPVSQIGVKGTPTLLLLDGQNKLIESWVGKLNSQEESEVIAHLQKACPECSM
jgi:thiol-disulfide isomerase/thioredoxin